MLKTPALIINKQNVGETDRILTIISPALGKKRVIARAIRRPLSHLAGHLDTMMLSQIMLTDEMDLPKVTGAVLTEPFNHIRNSLDLLEKAYAVTKIIERVVVEDVSERPIFQLTVDCLNRLNNNAKWESNWLFFLSKLSSRLGLAITTFTCSECDKAIADRAFWLTGEHKFVCRTCVSNHPVLSLEANSVKLLKLLALESFEVIERISIPDTVALQIEEIHLRLITEWLNKPWQSYASLA